MSETMTDMMIHARNVTLTLGSGEGATAILRGIDLDVARGERLAILGASGSGKSSLMAVLSGLERATSGAVSIVGEDFTALGNEQHRNNHNRQEHYVIHPRLEAQSNPRPLGKRLGSQYRSEKHRVG